jgi:hypothetical protein
MTSRLTARQFFDWKVYASLEPFDEVRGDIRMARLASVIANVMGRAEGQAAYTIEDFMLKFEEADEETKARNEEEKQKARVLTHGAWVRAMAAIHSAKNVEDVKT